MFITIIFNNDSNCSIARELIRNKLLNLMSLPMRICNDLVMANRNMNGLPDLKLLRFSKSIRENWKNYS